MPTRRSFIRYLGGALGLSCGLAPAAIAMPSAAAPLRFRGLPQGVDGNHHVADGYQAQILMRWGDALNGNPGAFSPQTMTAADQARRFGYNNDYVAYLPLPLGSASSDHGLLCVNHEYTNTAFMWPGLNILNMRAKMGAERTLLEMAAVGHSVFEVKLHDGRWEIVAGRYNRRVTARDPVRLSGPAAGHPRLQTRQDPDGFECHGILAPCSGGKTPWGTVLVAEENFQFYFDGKNRDAVERNNHARYGVGRGNLYSWWARHDDRFNLAKEPREANRFGWVVEVDPYLPDSLPVKRTALGRFTHEAANCAINRDGRIVVYLGDDSAFEYLYRFVTSRAYSPTDRAANLNLLDDGELSVAQFHDDGRLVWHALRFNQGPLTPENGFSDQGEVLIEARRAADLVGATRLDRPEDVEPNPIDGFVYALLTGNPKRHADAVDAANPRSQNHAGHILRLRPPGSPGRLVDHAANEFAWELFLLAGDPEKRGEHASYPGDTAAGGWFANPDNCAFDPQGRLWIASDQGRNWRKTGIADGLWAHGQNAAGRPEFRRFYQAPIGAEVCGPEFTPDGRSLFLAIQHPGVDGALTSNYARPATRWPDFDGNLPPRPSVVVIRSNDGQVIGD